MWIYVYPSFCGFIVSFPEGGGGGWRRSLVGFITLEEYFSLLNFSLMRSSGFKAVGGSVLLGFSLSLSNYLFFTGRLNWRRGDRFLCVISPGYFPSLLSFPLIGLLGIVSKGVSDMIDFAFSLSSLFVWPDIEFGREGGELCELSLWVSLPILGLFIFRLMMGEG